MPQKLSPSAKSTPRRVVVLAVALAVAWAAPGAVVYAPPDDSADVANEVKGIERELADRNYAEAAKRVEALLAARAHPLVNLNEGTLTSVGAWVDQIPAGQRTALAAEYAKAYGGTAAKALGALQSGDRVVTVEDLYGVARRFPMTQAAGAALSEAGGRALQWGDVRAAQALYELAEREGVALDEVAARRLEAVRTINGGSDGESKAAKPQPAGKRVFRGPLPTDTVWFGDPSLGGMGKFLPAAYDDRVLLASWNGVSMLKAGGQTVWASPNPHAPASFAVRGATGSRGPLFAPAVLADASGRPAIVVNREPGLDGGERYGLRAINAADGKTLWATDATDPRRDVSYAGLPAIAGRYVYAVAVTRTGPSTANLILSALDVMTGNALWQTVLGSVAEQGDRRFGGGGKNVRSDPLDLAPFAELSEPAVAGDLVICSPNCGAVIAVGRFDGRVRWVGVYRQSEAPDARPVRVKPVRRAMPRDAAAATRLRYRSTPAVCGDVVVAMPQDAPALLAFDRRGGKRLWDSDLQPAESFGLAGASGNVVVLCGTTLTGLDAGGGGKRTWRYVPPRGEVLTGPAVVVGQTVVAPASGGFVQLDVNDGTERTVYAVPDLRQLLTTQAGRAAADEAGASRTFGVPDR